jgi:quinol-cytochrome oxidoreductase complex cytochrome b subunit/mono/diheme cytochrome c family protein
MHTEQEQPSPPGFWEQRTGWRRLKQLLFLEPLPGGARWSAAFGSLLLFTFLLQVVTGILLAMNYAPSTEPVRASGDAVEEEVPTAWASVNYIQKEVPFGAFIRGLHHWGSSAMVILLLVHLVQVFVWGAYKKPRELTWMAGVLLLACVLGLAFTGYLLPWDQKAYWATKVGVGIASTTPLIGDGLRTLLQGGPEMGNLTLTRFFTFHGFVLPGLVTLLIVVHLYLFRLHGVTPSWWQSSEDLRATEEPFWPKQALKDGVLALVFLVGLGLWTCYRPAPLEAPADPAKPYEARPEWYFMFLFQLLRYFHGPYEIVGTFILPTLFFLVLFFWPFLDRSSQRDPRRRPVAIGLLGLGTAGLVGLTVFAIASDVRMTEPEQVAAKPAGPAAEPAGPIQRADVAKIYNDNCAACHGVDGTGKQIRAGMPTIPDFASLAWQMSQTDLEITHRIETGNEPLMPAYRSKLSQQQILGLAIYVRAFAITPLAPAEPKPAPAQPAPAAAQMPPAQLYRAYCLACHDADGRGQLVRKAMPDVPDLTDAKWQASRSDAELQQSILEGKGKFMLPMKGKLSPADADQLVAYVRAFRGRKQEIQVVPERPVVPPSPAQPRIVPGPKRPVAENRPPRLFPPSVEEALRTRAATELYRQYCLICHGADGRGAEMRAGMPTMPDFTSRAWQEGVSNPQLVVGILEGKGTLMPAFRGRVNDEQARDLTAYIRALGPVRAAPPEAAAGSFDQRFRELQEQWDELQRQLQELSKPPPKP